MVFCVVLRCSQRGDKQKWVLLKAVESLKRISVLLRVKRSSLLEDGLLPWPGWPTDTKPETRIRQPGTSSHACYVVIPATLLLSVVLYFFHHFNQIRTQRKLKRAGIRSGSWIKWYIPSWQQGRGNWTAKSQKEMNAGIFQSFSLFPVYLFCTLIPTMVPIKFRVVVPFSINCLQKRRPYAP